MLKRLNTEALLWGSVFIKFILAFFIPVLGDEAYYWFWGQNLQLSYFDHPGMVGWLTWAGSQLTFLPLTILINEHGEILHIIGYASKFLKFPTGKLTNNITKLIIKDLEVPISTAIQKLFIKVEEIIYNNWGDSPHFKEKNYFNY